MATSELSERRVRAAARRSYERGRLAGSVARGSGALALALPGFLACGRTPLATAFLAGFALIVAAGRYRGNGYEEGTRAGVVAGILPCLLPAALRLVNPDLCDTLFARGPWLCAVAGIAAGAILGLRSRAAGGPAFWGSAALALGFAATLGCIPAGAMGFAGLAIGVLAGGLPMLVSRRASV
jgi:hypothetical protein